ncbi:PDDEXK-like family protein [Prevotella sp.]|uniref:PD-(D/E)XK nuclease family protein n=1 Tax=Prevotella sp. TaxID=59823 RepID=UPI003DA4854B
MQNKEINIESINQALSDWNGIIESYITSVFKMIESDIFIQIKTEYKLQKSDKSELGFNVFKLISDFYYRENFHRDIIYDFLNPQGSHKEGNKYLMLFLDMLNINYSFFQNAIVEKEYLIENGRRIDTLITDNTTMKAIIIENKMNNASDMDRQLPDYYNYVRNLGYEIMSIVYIPLSNNKVPDRTNWKECERISIKECLNIIPAFSNNKKRNLCNNWLKSCINSSDNIDCISGLRQYVKLIKYLNINNMDNIILEKFYKNIKIGENLDTAISIRNMLNELPTFLAARVQDRYMSNYSPFVKIWRYKDSDTVFEGFTLNGDNQYYKLDVWCNENGYDLYFWNPQNDQEDIKSVFRNFESLIDFYPKDNILNKVYLHLSLYEEEKLYNIIDILLKELSTKKSEQ